MGFWYQKRKKIGGFNFNFSGSGVGVSHRICKGINVGVDSRGRTYISGGLFGFRYREYLDGMPEEIDPKKFFISQIPNKYKSTIYHKLALFLFWFFAIPFLICPLSVFMPDVENLKFTDYIIYGAILAFSAYRLFFSNRAKQRKLMQQVIYYAVNDDADNSVNALQEVINLEKNTNLQSKLKEIKAALLTAK